MHDTSRIRQDYEVIFDPMAKSAIVRRGTKMIWLKGPYSNFIDAEKAASDIVNALPATPRDTH